MSCVHNDISSYENRIVEPLTFIDLCIYVYVYLCVYVCMCMCMCMCTCRCVCMCMDMCMYTRQCLNDNISYSENRPSMSTHNIRNIEWTDALVRCIDDKSELAKCSADLMLKMLKCSSHGMREERVAHDVFAQSGLELPNDHFNLAEVTEGPCCGHNAFGIGTNKSKMTKACRIALLLELAQKGIVGLPDGSSDLASLLNIANI